MTYEKFDEIWDNIITVKKTDFLESHSLNDSFFLVPFARKRIYAIYQREKFFIKRNYMKDSVKNLDRHKVAACLMYAIMIVRPYRIKPEIILNKMINRERLTKEYLLLNEYVAFMTAISIVESFIEYIEKKKGEERQHCSIPLTSNGESYVYNTCLDLRYSRMKNNINILTFANVFFLLETGVFNDEI